MATTYNNLYLDTRARLRKAGIDAAQLEARELLCYASDKSREQLYRDMSSMFRRSWSGGWRNWSSAACGGAGSLYRGGVGVLWPPSGYLQRRAHPQK